MLAPDLRNDDIMLDMLVVNDLIQRAPGADDAALYELALVASAYPPSLPTFLGLLNATTAYNIQIRQRQETTENEYPIYNILQLPLCPPFSA